MNNRLHDMLMLVSRVQERRGDIRFMVRQDLTAHPEVHAYLDDVQWLTRIRTPAPNRTNTAAGKERLMVQLDRNRRRQFVPARLVGVAAGLSLLVVIAATNQEAARILPKPVDQAISGFFRRDEQVQASPLSFDLSMPAEASLDAAVPRVTN